MDDHERANGRNVLNRMKTTSRCQINARLSCCYDDTLILALPSMCIGQAGCARAREEERFSSGQLRHFIVEWKSNACLVREEEG